jgi:predicted dinucleotide-binding enzyme
MIAPRQQEDLMDIAIIGAGNVGSALGGSLTRAGHSVTLTATTKQKAERVAKDVGARGGASNREAAAGAEVVILAIPVDAVDGVVGELEGALEGKVVVDPTNRVDPNDPGSVLDGSSVAEQIKARVPGAHLAKAFNTTLAVHMADPKVDGDQVDAFVAGDDEARPKVVELAESIGFRTFDVGPLAVARVLEGMALVNISLNMQNGWSWQSEWKLAGPTG